MTGKLRPSGAPKAGPAAAPKRLAASLAGARAAPERHGGRITVPRFGPLGDAAGAAVVSALRAAGCVFAEDEALLLLRGARTAEHLEEMVARRQAGEPIEQVLGWAEFSGLKIFLEPGVFVPRRRTEHLVREAAALAGPGAVVLDLCCGAGALGLAVAAAVEGVELHAADIDPAAVRCARRNIAGAGTVYEGDLCQPLPAALRGRVDILIANTPYVPSAEIALLPPEAREHEPRIALDGGSDGLDIQRRVSAAAPAWLAPGGSLLVEASERQAAATAAIFAADGLVARVSRSKELDATVVIGASPAG